MKSTIAIAVLVFVVLVQSAVIYNDKQIIRKMTQDRDQREVKQIMDDYHRCIASLDEAHFANHSDDQVWLQARQGCRDVFLGGRD